MSNIRLGGQKWPIRLQFTPWWVGKYEQGHKYLGLISCAAFPADRPSTASRPQLAQQKMNKWQKINKAASRRLCVRHGSKCGACHCVFSAGDPGHGRVPPEAEDSGSGRRRRRVRPQQDQGAAGRRRWDERRSVSCLIMSLYLHAAYTREMITLVGLGSVRSDPEGGLRVCWERPGGV